MERFFFTFGLTGSRDRFTLRENDAKCLDSVSNQIQIYNINSGQKTSKAKVIL